jgi:hypothetical protein
MEEARAHRDRKSADHQTKVMPPTTQVRASPKLRR